MSDELARGKSELRARLLARRRALPPEALRAAAEKVLAHVLAAPPLAGARRVAAYVPVGAEPATPALLDALGDREVLLPVALTGGELDWVVHDGRFARGRYGLVEPAGLRLGAAALSTADVILAPGLAADWSGNRLGRGAGYYDRALGAVPPTVPVAVLLHDGELVDRVPAQPHDRPVSAAVTPGTGWVDLPGAARSG